MALAKKGPLKYVEAVGYEWTCGGYLDLCVEFKVEMLRDLAAGVASYSDEGDAVRTDIGYFYKAGDAEDGISWMWAIAKRPITENSRGRTKIGTFYLTDSESAGDIPNNKFFRELKKALIPHLEKELKRGLKEM